MKKIFLFLITTLPFFVLGQNPRVFTVKCNVAQSGGGAGYWQVSATNINDPLGLYDATEIAPGDALYLNDGGVQYKLNITTVVSAVGNSATFRVSNSGITGISSVPTTSAVISRGTPNHKLLPWSANISDADNQANQEWNNYLIDSLLASGGIDTSYVRSDSTFVVSGGVEYFSGMTDLNGPSIPNGEIAFGNNAGTGITSSSHLRYDAINDVTYIGDSEPGDFNARVEISSNNNRTPTDYTTALYAANRDKGTGTEGLSGNAGNYGLSSLAAGVTTGNNIGIYSEVANSSTLNAAFAGRVDYNPSGSVGIGVAGNVRLQAGGSGAYMFGGVFTLSSDFERTNITSKGSAFSTALIADNAGTSGNIFDGWNGNNLRLRLDGAGTLRLNTYGVNAKSASALSKTKSDYAALFATDGTVVENNISNGIYLPTVTKDVATDTIVTVYTSLYSRNDTVMNVTGRLLVNNLLATTQSSVQLTLPPGFTSDFTDRPNDITGTVTCRTTSGTILTYAAWAEANTSTDKIILNWITDGVEAVRQELNFNINLRKK